MFIELNAVYRSKEDETETRYFKHIVNTSHITEIEPELTDERESPLIVGSFILFVHGSRTRYKEMPEEIKSLLELIGER